MRGAVFLAKGLLLPALLPVGAHGVIRLRY